MDSQASSDDEEQVDRSSRSSSGAEEDGAVTSLKKRLAEAEEQLAQLQIENAGHKAQINRLQKDRVRKSILHQPAPLAVIEEVPKEPEAVDKMEQFFKIFNTKNISSAQLSIHAINSLVSLHQILYAKEDSSSGSIAPFSNDKQKPNSERAAKIAFNYVLEFTRQLNLSKMDSEANVVDLSYPISWLLSLFPYNANEESNEGKEGSSLTDLVWMPLHFSLALDSTYSTLFENSTYLEDIRLLLEEFGPAAFEEDVSPLSVAVSIAKPNLEAVKLIVAYRPDSVSKTDEDGSLPLMHACANNLSLDVIEYLIELYPAAIQATDSFGCAAVHYAAFYGCANTVKYLISVEPKCAHMVEGNGALPIHDAVQNQRSFGAGCTEMVEFLLQVYPDSVRKRDDYGAFPLHKAAKSSELAVVKLLHAAFPKGMFGPDIEGLLPMHYYAERHDKDMHLDLMQFVLQANPQSLVYDDTTLFAAEAGSTNSNASGGWFRSMFGGKSSNTTTTTSGSGATNGAGTVGKGGGKGGGKGAAPASAPIVHNKRKSVRPVRGSIHEYKR